MHQIFKSVFFNFEFVRLLGEGFFGGCETGEALEAAAKIKNDDPESWYSALLEAGERAESIAKEACLSGDRKAAHLAYLRASNYLRASQFMLNSRPGFEDPRCLATTERSVRDFRTGIKLLDSPVHFLDIPYENGVKLPGYLYLPPADKRLPGRKTPILINSCGGDSTVEESYFIGGAAAVEMGYAVLAFDGPGQGIVLRRDKLNMRPDWENVTSRVLDFLHAYAAEHPDLDLDLKRVGICGASLGGYFALRAAGDPRIAACVSVDPLYNMYDVAASRMPGWFVNAWASGWLGDGVFNGTIGLIGSLNFQTKWEFTNFMWACGASTFAGAMREFARYALTRKEGDGEYLSLIKCPVLVTGAGGAMYSKPESTIKIYEKLRHLGDGKRKMWIGREVSDGGLQAKVAALGLSQQRTIAFLDTHFQIHRDAVQPA